MSGEFETGLFFGPYVFSTRSTVLVSAGWSIHQSVTLDQIKLLTRNQRVNLKGVLTLGEFPPKEVMTRNGEIGHVKEDCKGTSYIHI